MVTVGIFPVKENSHGRAGNRTRNLMISSQRLWPLDHEAGLFRKIVCYSNNSSRRAGFTATPKRCLEREFSTVTWLKGWMWFSLWTNGRATSTVSNHNRYPNHLPSTKFSLKLTHGSTIRTPLGATAAIFIPTPTFSLVHSFLCHYQQISNHQDTLRFTKASTLPTATAEGKEKKIPLFVLYK